MRAVHHLTHPQALWTTNYWKKHLTNNKATLASHSQQKLKTTTITNTQVDLLAIALMQSQMNVKRQAVTCQGPQRAIYNRTVTVHLPLESNIQCGSHSPSAHGEQHTTDSHSPSAHGGQHTTDSHSPSAHGGQHTTDSHSPSAHEGQHTTDSHSTDATNNEMTSSIAKIYDNNCKSNNSQMGNTMVTKKGNKHYTNQFCHRDKTQH